MRFTQKVAIVTGAGSGIGRGIAGCLAKEGARVVLNDIRPQAAEESQRMLAEQGYETDVAISDISTPEGAEAVIHKAVSHSERLDLLVNCAGRQIHKVIEELQPCEWDAVLNVNLKGAYLCARAAIPFLAKHHGTIVNISSVHAQATTVGFTAYAASKAGMVAMTRAMALEFAPRGVRVNVVSPGTVDTALLQAFFDTFSNPQDARAEFLKFHPIGRFGTPEDIGEVVAFLGSSSAGFITGAEIVVDGGMTALLFKQ